MTDRRGSADLEVEFSILIVERGALYRRLCDVALKGDPRLRVVGSATTLRQGIRLTDQLQPDVVVVADRLPDSHDSQPGTQFRIAAPAARVVLFAAGPPPRRPTEVDAVLAKADHSRLGDVVRSVLGLAHPDTLDAPCPVCGATLLATTVLLDSGEQEAVCVAGHRVSRMIENPRRER